MKKGFTLIELLAVIVILAIIALIATPIIINIINDAKTSSNERSIELYGSAIKNAIAKEQLNGRVVTPGTYTKENPIPFEVEYEGEVDCEEVQIKEDGSVYLAGCTVNGTEVDYTYGEKEESEPTTPQVTRYYWFGGSAGDFGNGLPSGATLNASELGESFYLGFDVELDEENNQKVTAAYTCFTISGQEYCLKGADEGAAYETNQAILKEAFGESACSVGSYASIGLDYIDCQTEGLQAGANSIGSVSASFDIAECGVNGYNNFQCFS